MPSPAAADRVAARSDPATRCGDAPRHRAQRNAHLSRWAFRFSPPLCYRAKEPHMSQIIEAIDVDVPVRTAYDQWTQFESFPECMDGIKQVRQLDDRTLEWVADV